jgi:Sec-independent protein translocase protein TatA
MPFGFSMGEIVVTAGAVAVAFGPKDIPVIARGLGKLTGQAVGYVGLMSARMDALARDAKVHDLHAEMKASVSELVGVTDEIRGGLDVRAVGRKILADQTDCRAGGGGGAEPSPGASPKAISPSTSRPILTANDAPPSVSGASHLPFSAASLGHVAPRNARSAGGADILEDALAEQEVAARAAAFMASGALDEAVAARISGLRAAGERVIDSSKAGLAGVGVSGGGVSPGKEAAR